MYLEGYTGWFSGGIDRQACKLSSARKNMQLAEENTNYLEAKKHRNVLLGPFPPEAVLHVHVNRFGVIPKSGRPGKWRLIVDLSHQEGKSVNSRVDPHLCSLMYVKVDQVVDRLLEIGLGVELVKLDVKNAYRNVPVHPENRHLLGMRWRGRIYVAAALPFGLRSAPKF